LNYIREGTDKREVFPVHSMMTYRGRRGRVPVILSLNSRRRRVDNLRLRSFYLGERTAVPTAQEASWAPEQIWTL